MDLNHIAINVLTELSKVAFALGVVATLLHWLVSKIEGSISIKDRYGNWERHENNTRIYQWLVAAEFLCFGNVIIAIVAIAFLGGFFK